jgi:hypothetical protein
MNGEYEATLDSLHDCFCTRYYSPTAIAFAADMYAILDAVLFRRKETVAYAAAFPEHFAVPRIGTSVEIALLNDLHTIFDAFHSSGRNQYLHGDNAFIIHYASIGFDCDEMSWRRQLWRHKDTA